MKDTFKNIRIPAPPRPNSFAGLMDLYEANYIRLRKLCGQKGSMPPVAVSRITQGMDLYLQVLEQTRYTSTIALTHYFVDSQQGLLAYPDLRLRIYYDALQAEVIGQSFRFENSDLPTCGNPAHSSLQIRWRVNRFLFKWLSFCVQQGHSFVVDREFQQNCLLTEDIKVPLKDYALPINLFQ